MIFSVTDIRNVCNVAESHCLKALKIVNQYANGCSDWLIPGLQSVNPSREAISVLFGKYKRFAFVHHVSLDMTDMIKSFEFVLCLFQSK